MDKNPTLFCCIIREKGNVARNKCMVKSIDRRLRDSSVIYEVAMKGLMARATAEVRVLELVGDAALFTPHFARRTVVTTLIDSPKS